MQLTSPLLSLGMLAKLPPLPSHLWRLGGAGVYVHQVNNQDVVIGGSWSVCAPSKQSRCGYWGKCVLPKVEFYCSQHSYTLRHSGLANLSVCRSHGHQLAATCKHSHISPVIYPPTAGFKTGLNLLAAVASEAHPIVGEPALNKPGPFPAASLAPKVAKKFLTLSSLKFQT